MTLEQAVEEFRRAEEARIHRPSISSRQLRVFVEVYRERSVTDAADVLFLSQPTVSRALKSLEERFDVVLFERTKLGLKPTDAAEILFPRAVNALREIDAALRDLQGPSAVDLLSVGTTPEMLMLVAPAARILTDGANELGHLEAAPGDDLIASLRSRAIDLVILPALRDQIPEWGCSVPVRTIRFSLHRPSSGARSEILALPPDSSWERATLRGLMGHDPHGPTFEAAGGGVSKRLLREGFSVYLPIGCADDMDDIDMVAPFHEIMVHAITREPVAPNSPADRLIEHIRKVVTSLA